MCVARVLILSNLNYKAFFKFWVFISIDPLVVVRAWFGRLVFVWQAKSNVGPFRDTAAIGNVLCQQQFFFLVSTKKQVHFPINWREYYAWVICPNKYLMNWTNFDLSLFRKFMLRVKSLVSCTIHSIYTTSWIYGYPAMRTAKSFQGQLNGGASDARPVQKYKVLYS